MTRLLAIAELRLREGLAARLAWLVPIAFAVGAASALWARGADAAARAALADRVSLATVWGLAFVVAAVIPALGLPTDIRTGAAQTLLSSPVRRFEVVLGGTLGYGALASLLLVAMSTASVLGMQVVGVGTAAREPIRPVVAVHVAGPGDTATVDARTPEARFVFTVPEGLRPGEPLRVHFHPEATVESRLNRAMAAVVSVHRPGAVEADGRRVDFKANTAFTAHADLGDLRAGDQAELTFRRVAGGWKFVFGPGSVEIGGARRLYAVSLVVAALCAVPFLLLLAAVGTLTAARFGAPTAVVCAGFLFVLFVGRNLIVDAAQFIVTVAEQGPGGGHDEHDGHDHAPSADITPARVALAEGAIAVFGVLPRYDTFDRTDELVERRAPALEDVGRAAAEGLPGVVLLTAAGWLLFRRRELSPG